LNEHTIDIDGHIRGKAYTTGQGQSSAKASVLRCFASDDLPYDRSDVEITWLPFNVLAGSATAYKESEQ